MERASAMNMRRLVLAGMLVVLGAKVAAAWQLDLFGDEAFYWQCAQRPALHFADHPFVTAALVRVGTMLAGDTVLGVRLCFLVIGGLLPFAIMQLARPLVGDRDAWLAAGAVLVVPAIAYVGLVAIPDAPLLLLAAVTLAAFERASRSSGVWLWAIVGAAVALGLSTHYRFVLIPGAIILYLALTRSGRALWRRPGLWLAGGIGLVGLIPAVAYNVAHDFELTGYYLQGRHGSGVELGSLGIHLISQVAIVTPLLYAALIATLFNLVRRARAGDDRAALFAIFSSVHLGLFLIASAVHDAELVTVHWPIAGYLPLLIYLPQTLRDARPVLAWLTPATGGVAVVLILGSLASGLSPLPEVRWAFMGWRTVTDHLKDTIAGTDDILIADNYKLGAEMEFGLGTDRTIFVLDHPVNHLHGRAAAPDDWGIGERALRDHSGQTALVFVQPATVDRHQLGTWLAHVRSLFDYLEPVEEIRPGTGRRRTVLLFRGRIKK